MIELTASPTQEAVTPAELHETLYRGVSVEAAIYEATDYGDKVIAELFTPEQDFSGQEVYLGYSPSQDCFFMAVEGSMRNEDYDEDGDPDDGEEEDITVCIVAAITLKDNVMSIKEFGLHYQLFYATPKWSTSVFHELKVNVPDILDIRLD